MKRPIWLALTVLLPFAGLLPTLSPGAGRFFRWTGTLPRGTQVRLYTDSIAGPALTIV